MFLVILGESIMEGNLFLNTLYFFINSEEFKVWMGNWLFISSYIFGDKADGIKSIWYVEYVYNKTVTGIRAIIKKNNILRYNCVEIPFGKAMLCWSALQPQVSMRKQQVDLPEKNNVGHSLQSLQCNS